VLGAPPCFATAINVAAVLFRPTPARPWPLGAMPGRLAFAAGRPEATPPQDRFRSLPLRALMAVSLPATISQLGRRVGYQACNALSLALLRPKTHGHIPHPSSPRRFNARLRPPMRSTPLLSPASTLFKSIAYA